jgi:hypothetical protein
MRHRAFFFRGFPKREFLFALLYCDDKPRQLASLHPVMAESKEMSFDQEIREDIIPSLPLDGESGGTDKLACCTFLMTGWQFSNGGSSSNL